MRWLDACFVGLLVGSVVGRSAYFQSWFVRWSVGCWSLVGWLVGRLVDVLAGRRIADDKKRNMPLETWANGTFYCLSYVCVLYSVVSVCLLFHLLQLLAVLQR